ncbi:MAG: DUF1385 domain-containing protein [Calditrichaeota bacterium]|nr:DUF1385 domain-containing protein [Calditrichota bacterium]RQV92601.1 MAG: DUF1385 domain-containing protein [bacterium]RQV99770.1 MAG: DUF1385 domain-containing protein [Calditrichota bacterium]
MSETKKSPDSEEKIMPIGGQAVIEGVMMRSPERIATAVRRMNGQIELKIQEYQSLIQRHKWMNIPVLRGAITLVEVMYLGIKHLNYSADVAMKDAEEEEKKKGKSQSGQRTGKKKKAAESNDKKEKPKGMSGFATFATVGIALIIGLGLFFAFPLYATTHLFNIEKNAFAFNLVAGTIRIALFLGYIYLISLLKDVKRLFRYHGAEHKTIYAFESGEDLKPESARAYTTLHPRCGTSFLVMVMLVSLIFFSFLDAFIIVFHGNINLFIRLVTHLPLVTLVGGLSYEAIKASAKRVSNPIVKTLIAPGLALQRITTQEPDDSMLEVAIVALKAARGEEYEHLLNREVSRQAIPESA